MEMSEAYKYCMRCGGGLALQLAYLKCQNCGYNFYLNAKPVSSMLLYNHSGEFLFVKRSIEPSKGKWDFPGGFVDGSENFDDAVVREVKEETGIDIDKKALEILGTYTDNYFFQDVSAPTLGVAYLAKLPPGAEPKPADDVDDFGFFKFGSFPNNDQLAFESIRQIIKDLNAKFKNRFS